MAVKHSPGGNTPSNTTRAGEWLFTNQSGKGPTSQTDWYSSQGKPSNGGLLFNDTPSVYKYNNLTSDKLNVISSIDNRDKKRNHLKGKWVCVENDSVYASNPNSVPVNIVEELPNGSTQVIASINPMDTDTFTVQSSNLYYSQNELPVGFKASGSIHSMISLGLAGKEFAHYSNRYGTTTFYIYNTSQEECQVLFFNQGSGIEGTPDQTLTIPERSFIVFENNLDTWRFFHSPNTDICMSAQESSGDKVIIPPASKYIYRRRPDEERAMDNTSPDLQNSRSLFDSKKCAAIEIADGSGGDASMHLGIEHLSNRYTLGISLSDYHITSPFANQIEVYHRDNLGGWNLLNTHTFSGGSLTNIAGQVGIDGDGGVFDNSGRASYLAGGSNLWFFKGTTPFLLTINDLANDEETLLGWMEHEDIPFFPSVSQLNDYLTTRDDILILE